MPVAGPITPDEHGPTWIKRCHEVLYREGLIRWHSGELGWVPVWEGTDLEPLLLVVGTRPRVMLVGSLVGEFETRRAQAEKAACGGRLQ